ncbi:VOC family protein [Halovivax gelatinilyticus]|uniref:VOC family protein n=1 Tax=Halovivax gelatinilyticus TaxID=2961597 RepID=UPI0020CA3E24|nr:VOC family protein [Halovivax gelatinilyticus]
MHSLTPNLMVEDVPESVAFYERFGFELQVAVTEDEEGGGVDHEPTDGGDDSTSDDESASDEDWGELRDDEHYVYAQLTAGDVELMLQEQSSFRADVGALADADLGGSLTLYLRVDDVDDLFDAAADAVDVLDEPAETWYGMREFYVRDPNGYVLGFAESTD